MTGLEVLSILLGIVLLSIYLSGLIVSSTDFDDDYGYNGFSREPKRSHLFLKLFFIWIIVHFALALDRTKYESVLRVSKSDKVYYLEQYKSSDLVLDKETYDRLKELGNEDKLYIGQSFWVTTLDSDNKEQRYSISGDVYNYILEYKVKVIDVEYDMFGNKGIK